MTAELSGLIERARAAVGEPAAPGGAPPASAEGMKLQRVAQEFESLLLVQMLRDMRRAGEWEDEKEEGGLGAETFSDTIDVELASHLSKEKGIGLSKQLLEALDRNAPSRETAVAPVSLSRPGTPVVSSIAATADVSDLAQVESETTEAGGAAALTAAPVAGRVTSAYGWRTDPFTGAPKFHNGVDLRAAYGQDVQAAGAGRVVFSGEQQGYGTTVMIEHADGTKTRYAHLSSALVPVGAVVATGQPVGRAGHSGHATGTHVHFEVIDARGRPIPPDQFRG